MKPKKPESEIEKLLIEFLHRSSIDPLVFWYFNQVRNDKAYKKNTAMDIYRIAGLFRILILQNDPSYSSHGLTGAINYALSKDLKRWTEQGEISQYSRKINGVRPIVEFGGPWYRLNHEHSYPESWDIEFAEPAREKND